MGIGDRHGPLALGAHSHHSFGGRGARDRHEPFDYGEAEVGGRQGEFPSARDHSCRRNHPYAPVLHLLCQSAFPSVDDDLTCLDVTTGHRWFTWLCQERGVDPIKTFREEVSANFHGKVKGPFNSEDRLKAVSGRGTGFSRAEAIRPRLTELLGLDASILRGSDRPWLEHG